MKFAKELEDDLVPEWRLKYLDYKSGKKKIKAVARAFRNASNTPRTLGRLKLGQGQTTPQSKTLPYTYYDFVQRGKRPQASDSTQNLFENEVDEHDLRSRPGPARRESVTTFTQSPPIHIPERNTGSPEDVPERQPLNIQGQGQGISDRRAMRYGSIVGTPPYTESYMPSLELPDPAMKQKRARKPPVTADSHPITADSHPVTADLHTAALHTAAPQSPQRSQPLHDSPDPYHVGPNKAHRKFASSLPRHLFDNKRTTSTSDLKNNFPQSRMKGMFSSRSIGSPGEDLRLDGYRELDAKQDEFFSFLDKELDKIETFYRMKEEEASDRLHVLREQLHELRDQRIGDIKASKQGKVVHNGGLLEGLIPIAPLPTAPFMKDEGLANGHGAGFLKPIGDAIWRKSVPGKTSKAMEDLGSPVHPKAKMNEDKSDYTKRRHANEHVTYRFAKRRLKLALQEFYRGLELLKSYALLNRTGFRKINKKYDKAVNARPTGRYMSEKVNKAHFVTSNIVEGHIVAVEDLYARYFERGNHKMAVGKLRTKVRAGYHSSTSFRNGIFVAAGAICSIQGLIGAAGHLQSNNPTLAVHASYLLQLYAGYFLIDILFIIFALNCKVWTAARINYIFVFEYDTRHVLDWRQLAELPCFFLFLNGLFLWLNFREDANGEVVDAAYLYYPLMLIVTTVIVMCAPLPLFYHNARKWWGFSNWRLLLAGLYPVEFRDFYLGDMYCSETYAMSQVEIFFCLYAHGWRDPPQCNSNHSRLLGFLTTLPAIWRAFQCLRRYYDSRNWFPHLANCAKYSCNILYYMSLSMYRIHTTTNMHAMFIVFGAVNAIYCSFWDVAMDFSLGNPWAKHPFLRNNLGYRRIWVYYMAAVLDVVLRQQWIFYAIFAHDLQHSAFLSFAIGLAEVLRRGMWSLFRVENEHCNNVERFRASRDIPLPYSLPGSAEIHPIDLRKDKGSPEHGPSQGSGNAVIEADTAATGADVEQGHDPSSQSLRRRKTQKQGPGPGATPGIGVLQRVGTVIAAAHAQDFTKKKLLEEIGSPGNGELLSEHGNDSSDEENEEDEDEEDDFPERREEGERVGENEEELMEAQKALSRGQGT